MEQQVWIKILISFQAWCRRYLVRKELLSVQAEFEEIVNELEGSLEHLVWRGSLIPRPHFTDRERTLFRRHRPKAQTHPESSEEQKEQSGESVKSLPHAVVLVAERDEERDGRMMRENTETPTLPDGGRENEGTLTEMAADLSSMALDRGYTSSLQKALQTSPLLKDITHTPEALRQHRRTLAMELLWIQQAIASRKKYLTLKQKMEVG
ncbi:IQ domain-containing protein C [Hoplias malabaricus]|uniref:IQ domain-containing protein C n=1 Tax=Hoplias malabaricus TaxID=27720 RepID=UPI003461A758